MSRTITTVAELDALPVWAAIRGEDFTEWVRFPAKPDFAGEWVSEHGDRATSTELEPRVYGLAVLHDPSTPAPAPSVAPEAAVEAGAEVLYGRFSTNRVAEYEDVDSAPWREAFRAALTAVLPHLAAALSATREEVAGALEREFGCFLARDPQDRDRFWGGAADALLARFNITPKEGR